MKLKQALAQARNILKTCNVEDTALESEVLLRHALGISRAQLYTDFDSELGRAHEDVFRSLVERRSLGEPAAYITGHREFYGLDFYIDRRVLIPRPESELLVEQAIKAVQNGSISSVAEIGTGSGAIAVSLAVNVPSVRIYATDISAAALEVALYNCQHHGVEDSVWLLEGDMLAPLPEPIDLIIANMPYVRERELPGTGPLSFEPVLSLNGGTNGMDLIERLCHQVCEKLCPDGRLLLEIGRGQGTSVAALLRGLFPSAEVSITPDYAGIDRVVSLKLA